MSRAYDDLPAGVRWLDEQQSPAYPLRSYVDLIGTAADDVAATIDAIAPAVGGRSALVDPTAAPDAWLPWLAQLVGVSLASAPSTDAARALIGDASAGWLAGTLASILAVVRAQLPDPVHGLAQVYRDAASMWRVHVVTHRLDVPDPAKLLAAITAAGVKPAGVVLDWTAYTASWDAIQAAPGTWDVLESLGTWDVIEALT